MKFPLLSVVVPVFNGEKFILNALETIEKQNYPNIEIIIIDDGSTDSTPSILEGLGKDYIRIFRQDNQGPSAARNSGIKKSKGSLIAFLDADDLWTENRLQPMVKILMDNPEVEMVRGYSQYLCFGKARQLPSENPFLQPFLIGSALYRRKNFSTVGLFDPTLNFGEDVDWMNRAKELGVNIRVIEEVVLSYQRHDGNMTRGKNIVEMGLFGWIKKRADRMENKSKVPKLEE